MRYQRAELPLKLDGLAAARHFFAGCLAESHSRGDTLWVAHIDEQSRCLHLSCLETDDGAVSKILSDAATHRSAGIVLARSHANGKPAASERDFVRRLTAAAQTLDCTILDHLLFSGSGCTSLRQLGYL